MRQKVHVPAFASFDGVSGGMILDLSEEGLSMQVGDRFDEPLFYVQSEHVNSDPDRRVRMQLDLANPSEHIETTGYIAWADALGRAGVRFSDLPEEARRRLNEWLTVNATAPSQIPRHTTATTTMAHISAGDAVVFTASTMAGLPRQHHPSHIPTQTPRDHHRSRTSRTLTRGG